MSIIGQVALVLFLVPLGIGICWVIDQLANEAAARNYWRYDHRWKD